MSESGIYEKWLEMTLLDAEIQSDTVMDTEIDLFRYCDADLVDFEAFSQVTFFLFALSFETASFLLVLEKIKIKKENVKTNNNAKRKRSIFLFLKNYKNNHVCKFKN